MKISTTVIKMNNEPQTHYDICVWCKGEFVRNYRICTNILLSWSDNSISFDWEPSSGCKARCVLDLSDVVKLEIE